MPEEKKEEQQQQAPKRGPRGNLGEGTPGKRIKSAWKAYSRRTKTSLSLRDFARTLKGDDGLLVETWLTSKSGGTEEEKRERAKRRKERASNNRMSKMARKSKGKQTKKPAETSRTAGV